MKSVLIALVLSALSSVTPCGIESQTLEPVRQGETVRLWSRATGMEGVPAVVLELTADTLSVRTVKSKKVVRIARDSVWRLDVSRSRSKVPGSLAGTLVGSLVGGAGGWLASAAASEIFRDCADCKFGPLPSERKEWQEEDRRMARQTAIVGAGVGLLGGAFIGSRYLGHRWQRVSLSPRMGSSARAAECCAAVLSIAF